MDPESLRSEQRGPVLRRFALKLLITVALLALIARSIDGARVAQALSTADLKLVLLAVLCTVLLNALRPLRWLWLLQSEAPQVRYRDALRSHLFATGARLVVPGQLGELGKALAIDLDPAKAAGLAVVDLVLDVSTTLLIAALGVSIIMGPAPPRGCHRG